MSKGKTVLIASGKGGTGKSIFAVNLAAALADGGKRVALVDMDFGQRNLDLYLGLQDKVVYDMLDVLENNCHIKQAIIKDKRFECLYLLPAAPTKDSEAINGQTISKLLDKFCENFDYVIVDMPGGFTDCMEAPARHADSVLLVIEPNYAAIRDGDAIDIMLKKNGITNVSYIVNKVIPALMKNGGCPGFEEIRQALKSKIVGIIQYDDNINISANVGYPIVLKKGTYISDNMLRIARRVTVEK